MVLLETWDIYDKNRSLTGRTVERGSDMKEGDYHLVVHVCIFNSNNEMLIQQRQPWKVGAPNMWDFTVGGSALAGETSSEAACRETLEEIGYRMDFTDERPFFTVNFERGFDDYYLIEREINIYELTLQYEEVKDVKWASLEEIKELCDKGKFIDYYFTELLFEMRHKRGGCKSE